MSVLAKFKCMSITKHIGCTSVHLEPVYGGEDNKSWSEATPSGKLEMTITNPAATAQFEVGKDYFIEIRDTAF